MQGTVTAQFTASSIQAEQLLNRNLAVLRAALEGHGLRVERLGVQAATTESTASTRHDDAADQQNDSREDARHDAGGRESRGRYERGALAGSRRFLGTLGADFATDLDAYTGPGEPDREPTLAGVDQS